MRGRASETQPRQEGIFPMVTVSKEDACLAQRYRHLFSIYLSFVAFITLCYGVLNVMDKNEWVIGDWLINYRGGFVRRGLPGEIVLRAGHILHFSPIYIVLVLQVLTYVAMFYSVWRLLARTSWSAWVLVLLVSPATLAFQVLDPLAGLRKEEILLGGLGMLLVFLLDRPPSAPWLCVYLTALGISCVLSHEALIFFMPYLFAAVAIRLDSVSRALKICAIPFLVTAACGYIVRRHIGDAATARAICSSLGFVLTTGKLPPMCSGAIEYLTRDTASARIDAAAYARVYHSLPLYPIVALLAIIPYGMAFVALWRHRTLRRDLLVLASIALVSIAASLPLFIYAEDWGRWIYIHLFCVFLLLLFIDYRRQSNPATSGPPARPSANRFLRVGAVALMLAYATCWDLPHVTLYRGRFGYFGLAHYAYEYPRLHRLK
jgi:hypothetical protein